MCINKNKPTPWPDSISGLFLKNDNNEWLYIFLKTKQTESRMQRKTDKIVKLLLIIIFTNLLNIKRNIKQSLRAQIKALLFDFCQAHLINFQKC